MRTSILHCCYARTRDASHDHRNNLQAFYGYATSLPGGTHEAGSVREVWQFGSGE